MAGIGELDPPGRAGQNGVAAMRTCLSAVFLIALLLSASGVFASQEKIEGFLQEIDPWVVDDTTRVLEFIEDIPAALAGNYSLL